MHRVKWIFFNERRLRSGWRVAMFIGAYILGGKGLDALFTRLNLPVGFTWQGILGYETSDLVLGGCSFHGLALHGTELIKYAFLWALAMLGIGFGEEFLYRGYLLKTLGEGIGFWPAAVVLSSLFGLVHFIFKPQEDWIDPTSIALYGLFWCLTLRRTGSLWFAVGFHAASDYADMVAFAEPNTGNGGKPLPGHLLDIRFHGPDWLTGGPRF